MWTHCPHLLRGFQLASSHLADGRVSGGWGAGGAEVPLFFKKRKNPGRVTVAPQPATACTQCVTVQ